MTSEKKLNEHELLEFGVYHYVQERNLKIRGLNSDCTPDLDYFSSIKGKYKISDLNDWFNDNLDICKLIKLIIKRVCC